MNKSLNKYRVLNILLLITFVITAMVPITGVLIHKLASLLLLILGFTHIWIYRRRFFPVMMKKRGTSDDAE